MANVNVTDGGIPERTLTLQYQPLPNEAERNTPSVADGFEVKLYSESIKEVFKKEPQFQSINKGPDQHFKGDKTLVVDTMKAKHTFEISAYVYARGDQDDSRPGGKIIHSLPPFRSPADPTNSSHLRNGDGTATITTDTIKVGGFGEAQPLGDTGIIFDSETVEGTDKGSLDRGDDYKLDYDRGQITILQDQLSKTEEQVKGPFGFVDLGDRTIINEDITVKYDFEVTAQNIASLIRRMAQLGNPAVMRLDKKSVTAPSDEKSAREYLVTPKSVNIVSESENPDIFKIELELRKGGTDT
jgi:hypothetical protein